MGSTCIPEIFLIKKKKKDKKKNKLVGIHANLSKVGIFTLLSHRVGFN